SVRVVVASPLPVRGMAESHHAVGQIPLPHRLGEPPTAGLVGFNHLPGLRRLLRLDVEQVEHALVVRDATHRSLLSLTARHARRLASSTGGSGPFSAAAVAPVPGLLRPTTARASAPRGPV